MKKITIEIKWAFIFILTMLVWMFLEKISGLHDKHIDMQQYLTMLFMIPAILIYIFALKDKKRNYYAGTISYKQAFVSGFIITVIVTIFSPLTQWITSTLITPDYFTNVIKYSVDTGYFKTTAEATAYFNLKNYILQSLVFSLLMGLVTSAVVALFVRSKSK